MGLAHTRDFLRPTRCLLILFDCQESTGAMLINKKPGKRMGNTVELKYGPPTEILVLVSTSIIIG